MTPASFPLAPPQPGLVSRILRFAFRRPTPTEPVHIVVSEDEISLPYGRSNERVRLEEVLDVELRSNDQRPVLIIATPRRVFVYPIRSFLDPTDGVAIANLLLQRIQSSADGGRRLFEMERRRQLAQRAMARRPIATWVLLGLICAIYVLELATGALGDHPVDRIVIMLRLGANSGALVRAGDWHRIFTSNFLHGGLLHIYLNGMALLFLGSLLERMLGPARLLVIYLISALGGAATSVLFTRAMYGVGASTAIFGLLGALGALQLRFGDRLPFEFRRPRRWWIMIIGINGALPILVPIIDIAGHAGGAVAGTLVAFALLLPIRRPEPGAPSGWPVVSAAVLLSLAFVAAFGQTVLRAIDSDESKDLARIIASLEDAQSANNLAWTLALDRSSSARDLEVARELAERAVELDGGANVIDTLAVVRHRQGNFDEAIRLERRAIAKDPADVFFSQLATFLAARLARDGPIGPARDLSIEQSGPELSARAPPSLGTVEVLALTGAQEPDLVRLVFRGDARFEAPQELGQRALSIALVEPIETSTKTIEFHAHVDADALE